MAEAVEVDAARPERRLPKPEFLQPTARRLPLPADVEAAVAEGNDSKENDK